jgi:hypothetical protein
VSWQSSTSLTLLTEDAVEWVLTRLGWWSDAQLDVHQLSPGRIGLDAELLDSLLDAEVHIVDGVVERWNYDQNSQDGEGRTR